MKTRARFTGCEIRSAGVMENRSVEFENDSFGHAGRKVIWAASPCI